MTSLFFFSAPKITATAQFPSLEQKIFEIKTQPPPNQTISALMKSVEEKNTAIEDSLKIFLKLQRELADLNLISLINVEEVVSKELKALATKSLSASNIRQSQSTDFTKATEYTEYHRIKQLKQSLEASNMAQLNQQSASKILEKYADIERINDDNRSILVPFAVTMPVQFEKDFQASADDVIGSIPGTCRFLSKDIQYVAFGIILFKYQIKEFKEAVEQKYQANIKQFDGFQNSGTDKELINKYLKAEKQYSDFLLDYAQKLICQIVQEHFQRALVENQLRFGRQCLLLFAILPNGKELMNLKKELKLLFSEEIDGGEDMFDDGEDGFMPYVAVEWNL